METPYIGFVLEHSAVPIEENIARIVTEKVRANCCEGNMECEGLCNTARFQYKMLWIREWAEYARGN